MKSEITATILSSMLALSTSSACACSTSDLSLMTDRSFAGTNPCVVPLQTLDIEAGYYQNASAVGGTALAAYPLGRIRYGLRKRTEIVVDPSSAIAKSGANGVGIYTWEASGLGFKTQIVDAKRFTGSLAAEYSPVIDETALISTRPRSVVQIDARRDLSPATFVNASLGAQYFQVQRASRPNVAATQERFVVTTQLRPKTKFSVLLSEQSNLARRSGAQTVAGVSALQSLSRKVVLDADLGTAFNAVAGSKAHYLEGGLAWLL